METSIENAIETVDSARQHKCVLEGRRNQLKASISQVEGTAACTRREIETYFSQLQQQLLTALHTRKKHLLDEVNEIESDALSPLKDCQLLVEEGIEEASAVVNSGENLLNFDLESESGLNKVKKFISLTSNLSLDSVPEVPSAIEVPSISVSFNADFGSSLMEAVHMEGSVCRQSPVQITNLEAIPGGIIISWADIDEKEDEQSFIYKLQCCHGKLSFCDSKAKYINDSNAFKDEYIGPNFSCVVRNLVSNSIYTFRVSRCLFSASDESMKQWSPWSVCQEKMTVMPGFMWSISKNNETYVLSDKCKVATKKSSVGSALYSEISSYLVGYPISLKVEMEGKSRGKNDCFALCTKRDTEATGIHTKEGTLCVMNDGHVWVNGVCSQTKFMKIVRGTIISFQLAPNEDKCQDSKKSKSSLFRVVVTIGEHEAVFDWTPNKSGTVDPPNLAFAVFLKAGGWKISII